MVSSKAEFIPAGEASSATQLSGPGGLAVSSPVTPTRPEAQTAKSNRSRTSAFLSIKNNLRPRGKSVSNTLANDWGRPVGGSEGLGSIYNSTMDSRERSQVLRSVTTLTKDSDNDVTGAAAEAFSGNVTPSTATRSLCFASFRADSSNNVSSGQSEAPPSYQSDQRPEPRRGSEGSVVSHISLPRFEAASSRSSISQPSSSRRASSYFSSAASLSLSSSATSSGNTSVAASPGSCSIRNGKQPQQQPQQQQQPQSQRRSSSQFSAAARQAFRSSRSFLGLPNGISEDDSDVINRQSSNGSSDGADNNFTAMNTVVPKSNHPKPSPERELQMQAEKQSSSQSEVTGSGSNAVAVNRDAVDDDDEERRISSSSRSHLHDADSRAGGGESVTAANAKGKAATTTEKQFPVEAGHDAAAAAAAAAGSSLASNFEAGSGRSIGIANMTNRRETATGDSAAAAEGGKKQQQQQQQQQKARQALNLKNSSESAPTQTPSRVQAQEIPAADLADLADFTPASGPSAAAAAAASPANSKRAAETHQKQHDALFCFSDSASVASPAAAFAPSDDSSVSLSIAQSLSQSPPPTLGTGTVTGIDSSLGLPLSHPRSHSQAAVSFSTAAPVTSCTHTRTEAAAAVPVASATPLSSPAFTSISFHSSIPLTLPSCTSSSSPSSPPSSLAVADVASVLIAPVPTSSSSSSATNVTTTACVAETTAATTPSQSTSKLAHAPITTNSTTLPASSSSQHASSLHFNPPLNSSGQLSQTQPKSILRSPDTESSSRLQHSGKDRRSLPLTPPSSSGPCLSPRTSVSGARDPRTGLPSPASSAHGSVSGPASRRGSSTEPAGILVNGPLFSTTGPSPCTSVAFTDDTGARPSFQAASSPPQPSSGRVSFDLRRIFLFGGSSAASKMSTNAGARSSFAGIGNGQPPNAADANGMRQTSSPSGSASKFFSRISLPGSSRRGSAAEGSPLASPEAKSRSRFASFGRLGGRVNDASTSSPNGNRSLRNSMQPWASASTDVLGMSPGRNEGRNSLALAREEATRPRKSLHLPRTNLIDLDIDDSPDTYATTSSAIHRVEPQALPPIATATISKLEKPASPSLNSARQPSFNFLRRASATSTNSNTDNVNGERRGSRGSTTSFARTFMNSTLSRNSNTSDAPADLARTIPSPNGESASPTFRNGIFDSQSSAAPGNVAYPGMSSTVNWNGPSNAGGSSLAEVGPGEVDPSVTIPPYPGSAASGAVPTQPKTVADLASGVLAERRPSHGIDQEQDAVEASDTVPDSLVSNETWATAPSASATTSAPGQSTDSNASRQRTTRSSNALSHLPRLNSMRTVAGTASNSQSNPKGVREARTGPESTTDGTTAGETSEDEQEASEDEDESDLTGQTSDYHDLDTETDDETDDEPSPAVSRRMSAAPMAATGSSGGLNRNRPTESLVLPPAPSFIPNPTSSFAEQDADATPVTSSAPGTSNGLFSQTVGRDTWTSFNTNGFTPFETPTPSQGGGSLFAGPTPRARQELSESSYFAARPGTSNSNRATTAGTMSGDAPPPSPSIISRSRAPSSASMRTMRTPGSGTMTSGPVPNRSMPTPGGALPPLALHRQISAASGSTRSGIDRSKSPGLAAASSRPSTSGTLTPHQTPAGDRSGSRESSIDRPASERPSSPSSSTAPRTAARQIMGLDGLPASTSTRPNFYQQKSKSLVDLLGPASRRLEIDTAAATRPIIVEPSAIEAQLTPTTPRPPSEAPAYSKKDGLAPINTSGTAAASIASPSLGRRRSMFEMRAEPPPYSIIHNRPEGPQVILPREEEGKEKLPTYCCGVHIEGYLPRKMEFSAPGVQAKDRSWKRQYFVLHGTSLRVYKNDLSVDRHAANGSWGEMMGVHVHMEPMNEDGSNGSGSGIGLGAAAREAISHTPLGHHRNDASKNKEAGTQFDAKNGLIRNYTLQGAESGLAADYLKRRHVVRVRAEGEQFLLQTRSDRHVVDWIEALQAATNVSMDLEKRPMPKFITLPRRRRRRRRAADGTVISPEEQERRDLAEAQQRSIAEAGGRLNVGSNAEEATPRESMSQPGRASMSIENELNPSAAFERMLREDQEEGGRQSAAVV